MSAGTIQREPDPSHRPRKGDQYINPTYGVTITVIAVGKKDGKEWVVWQPASGVTYKTEFVQFVTTSRRVIPNPKLVLRGRR